MMTDYFAGHILGLLIRHHSFSTVCPLGSVGHGDWCRALPREIKAWMESAGVIVVRNEWGDEFRLRDGELTLWRPAPNWTGIPYMTETGWSV